LSMTSIRVHSDGGANEMSPEEVLRIKRLSLFGFVLANIWILQRNFSVGRRLIETIW
jgi:hypothetical protein